MGNVCFMSNTICLYTHSLIHFFYVQWNAVFGLVHPMTPSPLLSSSTSSQSICRYKEDVSLFSWLLHTIFRLVISKIFTSFQFFVYFLSCLHQLILAQTIHRTGYLHAYWMRSMERDINHQTAYMWNITLRTVCQQILIYVRYRDGVIKIRKEIIQVS